MKKDLIANPDVLDASKVTTSGEQWYTYTKDQGKFTDHGYTESTSLENNPTIKDFKGNRKGVAKLVKRIEAERTTTYKFNSASTGSMAVKAVYYGGVPKPGTANSNPFVASTAVTEGQIIAVGDALLRVITAGTTDATAPVVTDLKDGDPVTSGDALLEYIGTAADNTINTFKGGNASQDCSAIYVMDTEESEGVNGESVIVVIPNAQIQGTGQPKVQDFDGYEFTVTVSANNSFKPLAAYGDFGSEVSDVIVVVVPNERVEEVVNAYAVALKTYRDAL